MASRKGLIYSQGNEQELLFDFSVGDAVVFTADYWARLARALKPIIDAGDVGSQQRIAAINKVFDANYSKGLLRCCDLYCTRAGIKIEVARTETNIQSRVETAIKLVDILEPWSRARALMTAGWVERNSAAGDLDDAMGEADAGALVPRIAKATSDSYKGGADLIRWTLLQKIHRDATCVDLACAPDIARSAPIRPDTPGSARRRPNLNDVR